ncbi:hypothetical protein ANANG_G00283610, partial [Anguilla anguilla]
MSITRQRKYDIVLQRKLQNAVFTFIQTKPEKVNFSQFEVFAVKVEPSHWFTGYKGSDVMWSTTSPDIPMSPLCSLTSTGCLLWLASNLRPWCLHTRQLRGQHQGTFRGSSDPTHQP